jgi:transcription termination/antitermination protein NusG
MSPRTSVSASRIEQLPGQIRKLVDVRNGQKHATERRFFPGYVLAKMELTDGGLPPN